MNRIRWIGLLAAGPMSPALFRVSGLNAHLGPVASSSLRVASRLANRLKAGTAVNPDGLAQAELILITGPESAFPSLLQLALDSGIDWNGRTAVLLDSRRDASDLAPLLDRGAATATLDSLDAFADLRFVADAADRARRPLTRFAAATSAHIFFLKPGHKQIFAAGSAFTQTLFAPLVAASAQCLKSAGLTSTDALLIAEKNTQQTLRSWLKAGRKGWSGILPEGDLEAVRRQLQALDSENEVLSDYFSNTARLALLLFGEDPAWLNSLEPRSSPIIEAMDDPQAQRLAATGRLAANLAHDWNNLLTLLAAQAGEIAQSLPAGHPAAEMAQELTQSISHAADSPRRLLRWLREEPGQLATRNLNDAIRDSLSLVELALGRGIECRLDLDVGLPDIALDEPLFRNALLNLASNAATAMGKRGQFTIRTARVPGGLQLEVSDTGPGMDPETRARVFDPFFTTGRGGTGLGLETVRSLAESHHATIHLDSAPGAGTRFTIHFPLTAAAAKA